MECRSVYRLLASTCFAVSRSEDRNDHAQCREYHGTQSGCVAATQTNIGEYCSAPPRRMSALRGQSLFEAQERIGQWWFNACSTVSDGEYVAPLLQRVHNSLTRIITPDKRNCKKLSAKCCCTRTVRSHTNRLLLSYFRFRGRVFFAFLRVLLREHELIKKFLTFCHSGACEKFFSEQILSVILASTHALFFSRNLSPPGLGSPTDPVTKSGVILHDPALFLSLRGMKYANRQRISKVPSQER